MKRILISVAVLLLLSLSACTGAGDTQSSGWLEDFNRGYKAGVDSGYKSGFEQGARAGFNVGRSGRYSTFGDWFYDAYPQYR